MRIETDRLIIRSAAPEDTASLVRLFNDPDVRRFLPPFERWTIERAQQAVEGSHAVELERGYTVWIIELRETQEFIGDGGILPVADTGEVELVYRLLPFAWGRGFATEAVIAILEYGLSEVDLPAIMAIVLPQNAASCRVLEKAGMRYVGLASYYGVDGFRKYVADRTWQNPAALSESKTFK